MGGSRDHSEQPKVQPRPSEINRATGWNPDPGLPCGFLWQHRSQTSTTFLLFEHRILHKLRLDSSINLLINDEITNTKYVELLQGNNILQQILFISAVTKLISQFKERMKCLFWLIFLGDQGTEGMIIDTQGRQVSQKHKNACTQLAFSCFPFYLFCNPNPQDSVTQI